MVYCYLHCCVVVASSGRRKIIQHGVQPWSAKAKRQKEKKRGGER